MSDVIKAPRKTKVLEKIPEDDHSTKLVATALHSTLDADLSNINLDNLEVIFGNGSTITDNNTFIGKIKNKTDTVQVKIRSNATMQVGINNNYDHRLELLTPIGVKLQDTSSDLINNQRVHVTGNGRLKFTSGTAYYSNSTELQIFGGNIYLSEEAALGTNFITQNPSITKITYHGIADDGEEDFIFNDSDDVVYYESTEWQDVPDSSPQEKYNEKIKFGLLISDASFSI